jgi:hypothetical protein
MEREIKGKGTYSRHINVVILAGACSATVPIELSGVFFTAISIPVSIQILSSITM